MRETDISPKPLAIRNPDYERDFLSILQFHFSCAYPAIYNGQRTEYLIDPFGYGDVIAEYDGDGNLIARYDHGIGLVSRTDNNNNQAFYDFDGTGSTAGLTGRDGNNLNRYNYRPSRVKPNLCILI